MIDFILKDRVYELALSTSPCNEIGPAFVKELNIVLKELDPTKAQALILYSTMRTGFSAGADLRQLHLGLKTLDQKSAKNELSKFIFAIHHLMNQIDQLPLVTIGVIHGICFGGGFELALTCDLLIAEKNARFCFPELRLGIIPCFGGIPRLKRNCGNNLVQDLLFTGRSINAKKAAEIGLVSQTVGSNQGLDVARRIAGQVNLFPYSAVIEAKNFIKSVPYEELRKEQKIFIKLAEQKTWIEKLDM